jgi:hypothetical protein
VDRSGDLRPDLPRFLFDAGGGLEGRCRAWHSDVIKGVGHASRRFCRSRKAHQVVA